MSNSAAVPRITRSQVTRPNSLSVGVIVWLSSELLFFAGLFAIYFTHRAVAADSGTPFSQASELLNIPFAGINTLILVSSSVTCQLGVAAAERFQQKRTSGPLNFLKWGMNEWYLLTFILGAIFVAGQTFEYATLISEGLTLQTSSYGSVFYMTTGFHALHVIGGLIAFLFVLGRSLQARKFGHYEAQAAVATSYYWHFVDAVWIALFVIIYFLR